MPGSSNQQMVPAPDSGKVHLTKRPLPADMSAMALFTWHSHYAVGIPQVDAEHAHLFALADGLHATVAQGASKESVRAGLASLIDYTRAHFAHEEDLMMRCRYPGFRQHKAEHDRLTEKALQFQRDFQPERMARNAKMLRFLKDWLTMHIANSDRSMAEHLKTQWAGAGELAVQQAPRACSYLRAPSRNGC